VTGARLVPAAERREIERLARRLRFGPAGIGPLAGRGAPGRLGRAGEFEEYRPWRPGEELRTLDLRVWRRLRRRVARVDREDSALPLTLLVDRSASMADPARERCVRALALLLVAVARARGEPRRLLFFAGGAPHRGDTEDIEASFAGATCGGTSDFAAAFAALPLDPRGPGRVVVLSDAAGLADDRALLPLARLGRPFWLAPLLAEERSPSLAGAVTLHSREREPAWSGVVDAALRARYREGLAARLGRLERTLRAHGGDAQLVTVEDGWAAAAAAALARGRMLRR
jgi:uncharacterized protein (DUF58 family)